MDLMNYFEFVIKLIVVTAGDLRFFAADLRFVAADLRFVVVNLMVD